MTTETMARDVNALILDDSVMTRKMIMKDLSATGLADFHFTEADDGIQGLEKFQPGEFDIIFVDMQMPNKDGIEFLRDLHAQHDKYPPAVMITSERSMDVLEKAAEVGIKAFLLKPVDKERLQRGLKKIIDNLPIRMPEAPSTIPHGEVVPRAMQEMLKEICNLDIQPEPEDESVRHANVCFGTISIMGDVHWSVMLGFEQTAIPPIVSQFAGMEIPFESPDLGDAVSELVNVVAGHAKRLLDEKNVQADISLPVVNVADSIRTIAQRSTTCEHRHFRCEHGRLWTSVTVGINTGLVL